MTTPNQIEGGWTDLKGKVKQAWQELNDDELREFQGTLRHFVSWIQQKTGQTQADIERRLSDLDQQLRPWLSQMADTARDYLDQAKKAPSETADRLREELHVRHAQAEQAVREKPMTSVAVAFGAGLVAGVVAALVLRSK